jgi:hypothetical protein
MMHQSLPWTFSAAETEAQRWIELDSNSNSIVIVIVNECEFSETKHLAVAKHAKETSNFQPTFDPFFPWALSNRPFRQSTPLLLMFSRRLHAAFA